MFDVINNLFDFIIFVVFLGNNRIIFVNKLVMIKLIGFLIFFKRLFCLIDMILFVLFKCIFIFVFLIVIGFKLYVWIEDVFNFVVVILSILEFVFILIILLFGCIVFFKVWIYIVVVGWVFVLNVIFGFNLMIFLLGEDGVYFF